MYYISIVFILASNLVIYAQAQTSQNICENIKSYKDVLTCALENHPEAQQAKLFLQQNQNLIKIAEQRINPEVDTQFLNGKSNGDKYQYSQLNFAHTLELGGKRDSRIKKSELQVANTELDLKVLQEEIYLKTYLVMVRLRQINTELSIYDDALSTFERIQKQYRSRPRMTPEQKATYAIMDIAASDYRLRRRPLINELRENEKFLELVIGQKMVFRKEFFPALRKKWPAVTLLNNFEMKSIALKKSLNELELAEAELVVAKSEAWPNVKVGPTFETQSLGSQKTNSLGVNLSFSIPIFSINEGGKSYASAGVSRAKLIFEKSKEMERQQFELEYQRYQDAVKSIEESLSINDLERKHREVEASFVAGVIPSSLVIEIHRQMADFSKSLNDQEKSAIESLAKIYSIEGRLLSEGL